MFDILFGWRKASKCKKLIRRVQCRLELLKNKRCCIVKQLRHDVAQLLKHAHHQTAFQRVEQLYKDESMVQVYDLLGNYCEFIIINLPYIRKHKDCPDDINEAISTLIFSSARFGNLPELVSLRKLFGQRYGRRFITAALELSPGNLVNHQIEESLNIKNVPDDVKYRLLNEIASSCVEPEPLLLEYKPYFDEKKPTNSTSIQIWNGDVQRNNLNEALQVQISDATEEEGKIVYVDLASKGHHNVKRNSATGESEKLVKPALCTDIIEYPISRDSGGVISIAEDSCSETSAWSPEEMIYLDDIEEFVSPVCKNGNFQDQRLFVFKSFVIPLKEINDNDLSSNKESVSKSSRRMRKSSRKRLRKRSASQDNRNVTDVESTTYYCESDDVLSDDKRESHHQNQKGNKGSMEKSRKSFDSQNQVSSSLSLLEGRSIVNDDSITVPILETGKIQYGLELCRYSCRDEPENKAYSRAMTMNIERPDESHSDNIYRSNTFPFEQPRDSCRHIHPKLPDYDELAAKFMALKREKLLNKQLSIA